jgi:hypothetical protein
MKWVVLIARGEVERLARRVNLRGFVETRKPYDIRLDSAGKLLNRPVELGEKSVALGARSVSLAQEPVAVGQMMIEKQDETLGALTTVSRAIGSGTDEIVAEIKSLRSDLKDSGIPLG